MRTEAHALPRSPVPFATHAARVASHPVQSAVVRRLRGLGVRRDALDDMGQDVTLALLAMRDRPPTDERCVAAALDVAFKRVASLRRRLAKRAKYDAGPIATADEHPRDDDDRGRDTVEAGELRTHLRGLVEKGHVTEDAVEMLVLRSEGLSNAEIGARFGCSAQTVANLCSTVRRQARLSWARHVEATAASRAPATAR
jgi:DNA-directed RNA polymerase specialized sigma24 family protein